MLEISCFSHEYAKIKTITNIGGATGEFLGNLRRKGAFVSLLECGQTYLGLEWERVPAFMAHCEKNGIIAQRRK